MSQQGVQRRIPWGVPAAGVFVIIGEAVWVLASLLFAGLTCDESCDPTSMLWRDNPHAWQWGALPIVAGIGLICAIAAFAFSWRDRVVDTWVAYGLSAAAVVVWAVIWTS
jgi:hypothetical protein